MNGETIYDVLSSGISAEKVWQIATNKSGVVITANQSTRYNLSPFSGDVAGSDGTTIASGVSIDIPAGNYYVAYDTTATTGTATIGFKDNGNSNVVVVEVGNTVKLKAFTVPNDNAVTFNVYVSKAGTYSNFRIIPKDVYDAGFTSYQPYALSNVEITAAIVDLQTRVAALEDTQANKTTAKKERNDE